MSPAIIRPSGAAGEPHGPPPSDCAAGANIVAFARECNLEANET